MNKIVDGDNRPVSQGAFNALIAERDSFKQRSEKLEAAMREIAESKFCSYDKAVNQYEIGVADGHRYCAAIAREALQ